LLWLEINEKTFPFTIRPSVKFFNQISTASIFNTALKYIIYHTNFSHNCHIGYKPGKVLYKVKMLMDRNQIEMILSHSIAEILVFGNDLTLSSCCRIFLSKTNPASQH
jgi:hypothetical protein